MTTLVNPTQDHPEVEIDTEILDKLRNYIVEEMAERELPNASFTLAHNNRVLLSEQFGDADANTLFALFSCTKLLVAATVWQLIDEGALSPSDAVHKFIPEFGRNGASYEEMQQITLRHLMTHTGGFPTAPLGPPDWDTRRGRLKRFADWRTTWTPGTQYEYHPTSGHWVIAEMIEAVEGLDFREVITDRIIEPFGSGAMFFGEPAAEVDPAELIAVATPPSPEEIRAITGTDVLDTGEVTPEILTVFNDKGIRAAGVPGAGLVATPTALAMLYQHVLHNTNNRWSDDVLRVGTNEVLVDLPVPIVNIPAHRTLGLVVAGEDGNSIFRGMGAHVSPAAFGHNGASGQVAFADPASGISFVFATSGIERNVLRDMSRTAKIAGYAARLVASS